MSSVSTSDPDPDAGMFPRSVRVAHGCNNRSPSFAVVEAIATLAGVGPDELADEAGIVLYDHVDPDALDSLVEHRPDGDVSFSFTVRKYEVQVDCDEVVARPAE